MSRASVYNRNYPGKKFAKGVMSTLDAVKLTQSAAQHVHDIATCDVTAKLEALNLLNLCMADVLRTNDRYDMTTTRIMVNFFMADHEFSSPAILATLCTYIEAMLFQADNYHGFNNFKWANGGSTAWHNAYPNLYETDCSEDYKQCAYAHMNDSAYQSQQYHRIYF